MLPNAPLIAHGMNNTSRMLPLRSGIAAQKAYIRRTLDFTAEAAGVSPSGVESERLFQWRYDASDGRGRRQPTLDQMGSDVISRLNTRVVSLACRPIGIWRAGRHKSPAAQALHQMGDERGQCR